MYPDLDAAPKFRIWNLDSGSHVADQAASSPEDALRALGERYRPSRKGRFLVARIQPRHGNHNEFGVFTVTPPTLDPIITKETL